MKLSHLNGLRAFEATLRNGTFTAAADELGVTVAAVGQQIRGLENYLEITLFDRLPTGAKPTKDALAVASRLTVAFTQIEDVFIELGAGRDSGRLKITMSRFMLEGWMTQRMPDFYKRNPGIEISYHIAEEFVDLLSSDVDMAIRFSPEPTSEYAFDDLHHSCFMPLCTPAFASEHRLSSDIDDLTGVALYQFHDVTNDPAWIGWPELLERHAIRKSDSGPIQQISGYRVALSGEGLVLCSLTESFNDLKEGRLVAPLGPSFVTQYTYGHRLVWATGRTLTNPMQRFRSWVLQEQDKFIVQASELLGVQLK